MELFPGKTSTIILENDIRPNLTVVKRDADTGAPVAGAVFTVKAADGHSVDEIKTRADGTATLENLLPGVYEVTEKSVPAPYLLDAPSQMVTLYPNRNHTVYFENHKKPTLTIQKVDSITGSPIQGAKFQVWYGSNGTDTGELNDLGTYFTDASADRAGGPAGRLVQGDGAGTRPWLHHQRTRHPGVLHHRRQGQDGDLPKCAPQRHCGGEI